MTTLAPPPPPPFCRVGQAHKQLILHLQSTAVEKKIYRMLQTKQKVQDKLLKLFEEDTDSNPQR